MDPSSFKKLSSSQTIHFNNTAFLPVESEGNSDYCEINLLNREDIIQSTRNDEKYSLGTENESEFSFVINVNNSIINNSVDTIYENHFFVHFDEPNQANTLEPSIVYPQNDRKSHFKFENQESIPLNSSSKFNLNISTNTNNSICTEISYKTEKLGNKLRINTDFGDLKIDNQDVCKPRKRRRISQSLEKTCLDCIFYNRVAIFHEGLNIFYNHIRLFSQEGVFYKLHADLYVYTNMLFISLLKNRKVKSDISELECIRMSTTPERKPPSLLFPSYDDISMKTDYLACFLLALSKFGKKMLHSCFQIPKYPEVEKRQEEIFSEFGNVYPENTCEIWEKLKSISEPYHQNQLMRFSIHYIYYEIIIHATTSDLQGICTATPSDIANAIFNFAINEVLPDNKQANTISACPTLQQFVRNCLSRSQLHAADETSSEETMALMYRRVINTAWPGEQDFITNPLEHRHLFRIFITYRYPSLKADVIDKITGEVLHMLGMSVVPEVNPSILYFNPESRNYWKEASKPPCNHLESMTKMGKYYLDRQQYDLAYEYINQAANENYSEALTEMATMYRKGWGPLEPNNEMAVECYKKAIEIDDDGFAHVSLGYMYERGYGIEENLEKAFYHYRIASSKGQEYGSAKMGLFYQYGNSVVKQDWRESLRWYRIAQQQNYEHAENHIADLLEMVKAVTLLGNI